MNRNHPDAYSVRMDKRAEYEKKYPIVYFHGSDAANAFVARAMVAILLCAMFFFALYKPWVDPIVPNVSIFILAPVCLFLVVLAYRSIGFATSVLVIGFLGAIAATFVQDSRNEAAKREAALRQGQRADAPLGACGIYAAALARHQKEGERLRAQACLAAMRAEQSRRYCQLTEPTRRIEGSGINVARPRQQSVTDYTFFATPVTSFQSENA